MGVSPHWFSEQPNTYLLTTWWAIRFKLSVQPYFPFSSPPTSALRLAGICPAQHICPVLLFSQACTCTLYCTPFSTSLSEFPFLKTFLYFIQLVSFLLKHLLDHPHLMVVPYFLTLDWITINISLYNIHIMISCEFLPQRPLNVMNMPDAFFQIRHSKCPHARWE